MHEPLEAPPAAGARSSEGPASRLVELGARRLLGRPALPKDAGRAPPQLRGSEGSSGWRGGRARAEAGQGGPGCGAGLEEARPARRAPPAQVQGVEEAVRWLRDLSRWYFWSKSFAKPKAAKIFLLCFLLEVLE